MIAYLHGEVLQTAASQLVVKVGGIGLQVFVPAPLAARLRVGDLVSLNTHLIVREDLLALYGFEAPTERDMFLLLLGVNGIGPRTALAVISTLTVDAIRRAVLAEQADIFARVPGVGKKTGQKILLQLQGKVGSGEALEGLASALDLDGSVIEALTALGYSVVEAQAAVQSIPRDAAADVEERLRLALHYFST